MFWWHSNWLAFSAAVALSVDRDGGFSGGVFCSSHRWARWKDRWQAGRSAIDFDLYPRCTQFTGAQFTQTRIVHHKSWDGHLHPVAAHPKKVTSYQ